MKRIANRWRMGVLCLFFLVITALPVSAAGPYDGIWFATQSCLGRSPMALVMSVTENYASGTYWGYTFNMVLFALDPETGEWNVDFATRDGSTMQGVAVDGDGDQFGAYTLTATSLTTITGTGQIYGVPCSFTGTKVF